MFVTEGFYTHAAVNVNHHSHGLVYESTLMSLIGHMCLKSVAVRIQILPTACD